MTFRGHGGGNGLAIRHVKAREEVKSISMLDKKYVLTNFVYFNPEEVMDVTKTFDGKLLT